MRITKRSRSVLALLVVVPLLVIAVAVFSARQQERKKPRKEWLTVIPQLQSEVKDLEIINPRIIRQDTESPALAFEVWNKSNRGVMAIEIACGQGSIATDGLEDDENPSVIIEPFGTLSAEMNDELSPDKPVVITAAVFSDQKEEGRQSSLELMHKVRVRQRAILKAQKAQEGKTKKPNQ